MCVQKLQSKDIRLFKISVWMTVISFLQDFMPLIQSYTIVDYVFTK